MSANCLQLKTIQYSNDFLTVKPCYSNSLCSLSRAKCCLEFALWHVVLPATTTNPEVFTCGLTPGFKLPVCLGIESIALDIC